MSAPAPSILIVDDEPQVLDIATRLAEQAGYHVVSCQGGREALAQLERGRADLALVDMRMPDVNGLDVVRAIREKDPGCRVALMTGYASIDSAVEAIKLGAFDYLTKPFDMERLAALLETVREETEGRHRMLALESDLARRSQFHGMIGRSPVMQELFDLIRRFAPHIRTALVTGETGTGKELVARALHLSGPRRTRRYVTVNCSAVVETLFESELFGHVRGAFTGATDHKAGLFEAADGGTLFLDEIGELPLAVQAKLLRVLELGEVQRVGALETRKVDVRVVAATNRDLRAEVAAGRFRSDLYYRLNIVELRVPPLRTRREDIPLLAAAFIAEASRRMGRAIVGITPEAERLLQDGAWEGNVRELRNVIERACILADGRLIAGTDVIGLSAPPLGATACGTAEPDAPAPDGCSRNLRRVEDHHVMQVLEDAGGNKVRAARALGISRRALYRRLKRMNSR